MPVKPSTKKEEPAKKEEAKPAVAAPAEAAPAAKAAKPEKKREKKHKEEKGVHAMNKIESDKVSRTRPTCERCGPGYFTADHHDRYTCGLCGFTRFKPK